MWKRRYPNRCRFFYVSVDRRGSFFYLLVMYICYDKRFIFFHVPRVAGTALLHKLRKTHDIDMQIGEHESMEHLYDNFGKSSDLWADYFKLCFVRNPWDRLVSAFHYLALGGINFTDNRVSNLYIQHYDGDFNEFVKNEKKFLNVFKMESSGWFVK